MITDRADRDYAASLNLPASVSVEIGIFEQDGGEAAEGLTVAALGFIHEFGVGVPQRAFLRGWYDSHSSEIETRFLQILAGAPTVQQAFDRFSLWAQAEIQKGFSSPPLKGLSEETKRKKGSSTPLVDTGALKAAVRVKVVGA